MNQDLCLVTGATGAVGPVLVRHLVNAGFRVRAIARHMPAAGTLPDGAEFWPGDIIDREFVRRAVEGTKVVFHLAAKLHVTNPTPELDSEYWRTNVEGALHLVDACMAAGVQRLIYFSSINVYGPTHGTCPDEDAPLRPAGLYAKTKRAAEETVLGACDSASRRPFGVVLRFATIYGPRMKGNYLKLVSALSRGTFLPVGDGSNRRTLVYEHDAARAALLAAQHPHASGRIFNVSDGRIYTLRDIMSAICAVMGKHPPRFFLPVHPARRIAAAADGLMRLAGRSLNLTTMVDKFVEDSAVRAERIQRDLGFQALFSLQDGWRNTVAALQSRNLPQP